MELVSAAAAAAGAATAGEAAVTTVLSEADATVVALPEGGEVTAEAREALLSESGLIEQLDTIHHRSLESLAARNEAVIYEVPQIEINRCKGEFREKAVGAELEKEYPQDGGYRIESQCPLRDEAGKIVLDPISGESRRLDYIVTKDGQVVKSVEVTSETADKSFQLGKEDRIREAGGNYVKDRTSGELVPFAPGVRTEIIRRT